MSKPCSKHPDAGRYGTWKCAECAREYKAKWAAENRERIAARSAALYASNRKHRDAISAKWARDNPDKSRAIKLAWRRRNPEKQNAAQIAWRQKNPAKATEYYAANKEKHAERVARWARNNPDIRRASVAKGRAAKLQRTPLWADLEVITLCYTFARVLADWSGNPRREVDHVIPLQGRLVSGLHVPENLQLLPERDNASKQNRFNPDQSTQEIQI